MAYQRLPQALAPTQIAYLESARQVMFFVVHTLDIVLLKAPKEVAVDIILLLPAIL
jgi:hypothetical protein